MQRWQRMSAASLGRSIERGDIDPVDLTEHFLAAIAAHPMADRIYARLTPDRARAGARAASARAKSGRRLSPLDGVPISWKDLFDTAGTATEAGSKLLAGRTPERDAEVLQNATAAGLICLGKTHMSELAFSGLGLNPMTATSPCVNDPSAVAGGSSSGAAASVAFGLAAAAIGSDTGGSVRIPAAWNDLVGLKTTSGRVSLDGVVPLCPSFDTVGPLTRTVEDAALLLTALEGGQEIDLAGDNLEGKVFVICETTAFDDLRDAPRKAFNDAIARIQHAGAQVKWQSFPEVAEAMTLTATLYPSEAYGLWKDQIEAAPDKMFGEICVRFRGGANVTAPEFVAAWRRLDQLRDQFWAGVAGFDGVLLPSSPILPPNADRLMDDHDYYVTENLLALRNTRIGNLMKAAAITVPTETPSAGIMLMAPPLQEARLLRNAASIEAALQ